MYKPDNLDSQGDGKLGTVYSNQKTSFYSNMQQSRGPITPTEMFRSPEQSELDTETENNSSLPPFLGQS